MKRFAVSTSKYILKAFFYGVVGGVIMLLIVAVNHLNDRPDLSVWHTADLDEEFTKKSSITTFDEYLTLEDRLFKQLNELVYEQITSDDKRLINRYYDKSISDPNRWPQNWNRSFELAHDTPRAGILLLHGMSDSPYSLRHLGEHLHENGAHVVGLRIPGHGTAPSGLASVKWEDMAAAVKLAVRRLDEKAPGLPLYIIGYSNGAALAVNYALNQLEDESLANVDKLVLISPEIAITPLAALAVWQERLAHLLGMQKLAWTDILPEYDPFKYNSFAVNAGNQVHRITDHNQSRLLKLSAAGKLDRFPHVLAFQSAVDATVSAPAVVKVLFEHLPKTGHELVVFDLNRSTEIEPLLKADPIGGLEGILTSDKRTFTFTVVSNETEDSEKVSIRTWPPGTNQLTTSDPGLAWPRGIYSLTHVALPFPGYDALYGGDNPRESPGIQIGTIALRGEKGVLEMPITNLMRLRWNPFYPYLEEKALEHLLLAEPAAPAP